MLKQITVRGLLAALAFLALSGRAYSETKSEPKLEVGIAGVGQYLADYRGSSEYHPHALPLPIILYDGDFLKIKRTGVYGDLYSAPRWKLTLSAEGSLSSGSSSDKLRKGMPDLQSTGEVGPSLNFRLSGKDFEDGWALRLPVRAVFAVGFSGVKRVGYLANPQFTYRNSDIWNNWHFSNDIGFLYGSRAYHDYYYSVDQRYVTPERPFYRATSGYSGWYFESSVNKREGNWWWGAKLRYDNLSDAVFLDSPLVETKNYFALTFVVSRFIWSSNDK